MGERRKCRVVGNHTVYGTEPGGLVMVPADRVEALVLGGHLELVRAEPKDKEVKPRGRSGADG